MTLRGWYVSWLVRNGWKMNLEKTQFEFVEKGYIERGKQMIWKLWWMGRY